MPQQSPTIHCPLESCRLVIRCKGWYDAEATLYDRFHSVLDEVAIHKYRVTWRGNIGFPNKGKGSLSSERTKNAENDEETDGVAPTERGANEDTSGGNPDFELVPEQNRYPAKPFMVHPDVVQRR